MKLKKAGVNHIHAHYALDSCKFAMLMSMLTGIPYSFTIHAHDIFLPKLSNTNRENPIGCLKMKKS